ncbi:MAG TPA: zinc-binding dehydrogenase [Hymenobacter sp.]|uniref:zinc-binding dehydrogenase n=1 Tax=Hymenobacter sp. TaxID=1898978 RepID=UPI002ED939D5
MEERVHDVDVVLEASPLRDNAARAKAVSALKDGGIFVSVNVDFPFDEAMQTALANKKATGELSNNQPRREWLQEIAQLIDAGRVQVFISQVFSLVQVADAHRESQTWHVQGKLVLQIYPND